MSANDGSPLVAVADSSKTVRAAGMQATTSTSDSPSNRAVAVRARGNLDLGVMPLAAFQKKLLGDIALKT